MSQNLDAAAMKGASGMASLRAKMILAFFIISSLVSVALAVSAYRLLSGNLFSEMQTRVKNLAYVGSLAIDADAMRRLVDRLPAAGTAEETRTVLDSPDFRSVYDTLNMIRAADPRLIRYVYTFAPTTDRNRAVYVVDADVLSDLEAVEGAEDDPDAASLFGAPFDITEFPVARQAIDLKVNLVESGYTYDEEFGVHSITGYAPIVDDEGTLLAVIGIDMVDTDVRVILRRTATVSFIVSGAALLLTLGTSIVLGALVTRNIIRLEKVVRSFGESDFTVRADIRTRDEVGRLGASFNGMAQMIQSFADHQQRLLTAYGRFVPRDFLRFLEKESIVDLELGDQVQKEMTIMFSDVIGFTNLSQSLTPEENFNFINSYLSRMGPEIRAHNGFIDKYIGDGIMALFPDRPDDGVHAAIAMRRKLAEYNIHRKSIGYRPIDIGIGLNTGLLMLGTVGERERMDGSVISDAVNLCSRLEALTRVYGCTLLVTGQTLSKLENQRAYHHRFIDRVRVRGRNESVIVYEIYDGDDAADFDEKKSSKSTWMAALNHYYAREFRECYLILRKLKAAHPNDRVVEVYIRRCARLIKYGIPEGWEGVEIIDAK